MARNRSNYREQKSVIDKESLIEQKKCTYAAVKIHESWMNQDILELVGDSELISEVGKGDFDSWKKFAERIFRGLGMPAVMSEYVRPSDPYVARYANSEVEKGITHINQETNLKVIRYEKFKELIEFNLRPEDLQSFRNDLAEAGGEMTEFGRKIIESVSREYKLQEDLGQTAAIPIFDNTQFVVAKQF